MCRSSIFRSMHHAQEMPTRQLRPVTLAANRLRDTLVPPRSPPTLRVTRRLWRKLVSHFQRQALSRARIHHAQHPDRFARFHRIMCEVPAPIPDLPPCGFHVAVLRQITVLPCSVYSAYGTIHRSTITFPMIKSASLKDYGFRNIITRAKMRML